MDVYHFLLDLCTKLPFPDSELSDSATKKCRDLAGYFTMSCQAAEILRLKQGPRPLDVVKDVAIFNVREDDVSETLLFFDG